MLSRSVRKQQALEKVAEIQASLAAASAYIDGESTTFMNEEKIADSSDVQPSSQGQDDQLLLSNQENEPFIEIERLHSLGISSMDITKLKSANINTVAGAMMTPKRTLLDIKGMTESKLSSILSACAKLNYSSFQTAVDVLAMRNSITKITTGSQALDQVLAGGIESTTITELFGEFRTGKTQLVHTLCVTAQLPKDHRGGNGRVAFIDTVGTFRPERIIPIAERYGIDPTMTLQNIMYARAYTTDQQDALITTIAARMAEDQFALLIVDSFTSLFRLDYVGREDLAIRQQAIGAMMNKLSKMASEFNIAIVITSQVMSDPSGSGGGISIGGEVKKPVGGHVLAHASTTRLFLRKGKSDQRICRVYDSPYLPESEAVFTITNGGISDASVDM